MTVTLTLKAADGATSQLTLAAPVVNSSVPDGSVNAPASTGNPLYTTINTPSQGLPFSTFLNRYGTNRPSWHVAGIDYPVGIRPPALPLKDPASISIAGVSVNATNHRITITASNVTLQGYDFSLANGWQVQFSGNPSNVTIEDCYFKVGSNFSSGSGGPIFTDGATLSNLLVQYCVFDVQGQNINSGSKGAIELNPISATVQYCWFLNGCSEYIVMGPVNASGLDYTIRYNVFCATYGQKYGNHGDVVQFYGPSSASLRSLSMLYNTVLIDESASTWAMQGYSLLSANQAEPTLQTLTVTGNTFCCTANAYAGMNTAILAQISWIQSAYIITNNYIDPLTLNAGAAGRNNQTGSWINYNDNGGGVGQRNPPYTPTATVHGNINLQTGSALPGG